MTEQAHITAGYSSGCFCERPKLKAGEPVPYNPRFEFVKAAKSYCSQNGLTYQGKAKGLKVAFAVLPLACNHRPEQDVRLDWGLHYG